MRILEDGPAAAVGEAREGERIGEIKPPGAEITILQSDIDGVRQGSSDTGDPLVCPGAVAVAELLDAGAAETAADIGAEPGVVAEIEQRIGHQRRDADLAPNVKAGAGEGGAGTPVERGEERRTDVDALGLGLLEAGFAFEPEHAEVVAADQIDVPAGLEVDVGEGLKRNVGYGGDGKIDRSADVLVLWEQDAAFDTDIAGAVASDRRSCDRDGSDSGKQVFAHLDNPFFSA